jgi:hypothetical protein
VVSVVSAGLALGTSTDAATSAHPVASLAKNATTT